MELKNIILLSVLIAAGTIFIMLSCDPGSGCGNLTTIPAHVPSAWETFLHSWEFG